MLNGALAFVGFFLEATHVSSVHIAFTDQIKASGQHDCKSSGEAEPWHAPRRSRMGEVGDRHHLGLSHCSRFQPNLSHRTGAVPATCWGLGFCSGFYNVCLKLCKFFLLCFLLSTDSHEIPIRSQVPCDKIWGIEVMMLTSWGPRAMKKSV